MEPLSPGLNLPDFDIGAYLRESPNLMSALRASLPAAGRLFSPGAFALNLGEILDAEDPIAGQVLPSVTVPRPQLGPRPPDPALPSLLPSAPTLRLGAPGTAGTPLWTAPAPSDSPILIHMSTQTSVDMYTQTSPSPVKETAPTAPGGGKRSRGRAPTAPAASGRSGGGISKPHKASSEFEDPRKAALASPPPPGPRTARRKPTKPTAQGPAKKAATAPAGGEAAAPGAPKKRPLKEQSEPQAVAKKAKVGSGFGARPTAAVSESHGSAAPLPSRFGPQLPPRPTPQAPRPTQIRLKDVAATGPAPSRGAKALTLARDPPAAAPRRSSAKIRLTKPKAPPPMRPELFKAPKPAAATAAAATAVAGDEVVGANAAVTCEVCGQGEPEETMLLCGGCDRGFHGDCLRPAVHAVPPGPWFCCPCRRAARAARAERASSRATPSVATVKQDSSRQEGAARALNVTKSQAAERSHLPLPPGKLRRARRSELQVLVFLAARVGQGPALERELRLAHGNNPDVSKAVRALVEAGAVARFGEGTKANPYTYALKEGTGRPMGSVAEWQAELDADAAVCAGEGAGEGDTGAQGGEASNGSDGGAGGGPAPAATQGEAAPGNATASPQS